jgi:DNA polymerase-3 subunit alpha
MIRPGPLFARAREFKMPAVAATDHGNMFGAIDFYRKGMESGVKPIVGCEVYVAPGKRTDKTPQSRGGPAESNYHLVLLVKNMVGYRNLCKLLSLAYKEGFYYRPRVDKELLQEHNEGLIALSACLHGEIAFKVCQGRMDAAMEAAEFYSSVFKDRRFFLEIQENGIEEQRKANEGLVEIASKMNLPLVATNDCHYLAKEDARFHDTLLCIQTGKTVNSPDRMKFSGDQFYFKSPEEMAVLFSARPEALRNTVEIAERCNLELELGKHHLPDFPVPEGETLDSALEHKALKGLERRLKAAAQASADGDAEKLGRHYSERLKRELDVIKRMGFSGYFLIVDDFIGYARTKGIPVGPGRGSAAGSLVAYALGVTNLDPIRYNLLFERFLNPDRISLPDIDIDFCIDGREEVIRYVSDKYGKENVTQIITFGQMKAKAVIRDVGRALDMAYAEVDKIAKLVPNQLNITLDKAIEMEPELKKLSDADPRIADLLETARVLEGLPRHASTHAAGVVISNKPLTEYLPLYMGQKDNVVTTQYPMNDVEKIGLVKFDFLGLKTLTVMDRAVRMIREKRGIELDIDAVPLDDKPTYEILSSANTNGIFQLESSGIKDVLRKLKPSTFEDLTAAVALYRPGPLKSGMVDDFIKRKHGKTEITYELPELEPILENTYGVMVYQEQVMEIARVLAGFTPGEADVLRKVMGKKLEHELADIRKKFLAGAEKKKLANKKKAETIFDLISHFAGYGFNKSHSAAYALIACQTAYLKAHYPMEFMAALLTMDMGDTDKVIRYMNECKERGIAVTPPDVNKSSMDFTVEDGVIVFGLGAIKNVGESAIMEILSARSKGRFEGLLEFLSRVDSRKVNKKVVEALIKCGAFDFAGEPRARLFAALDPLMSAAESLQRDRASGQQSMFGALGGGANSPASLGAAPAMPRVSEWPDREKLSYEKEALGVYISSHPLEGHASELERVTTHTTEMLDEVKSGDVVTVGGVVTEKKEITTKKGDRMAFVRVEDLYGSVEAVVFSDLYKAQRELFESDRLVVLTGRVDKGDDAVKIVAEDILPLEDAKTIKVKNVHILAGVDEINGARLTELKGILESQPGASPVYLHLLFPDKRDVVIGLPSRLNIRPREETLKKIKRAVKGAEIRLK